MPRAARGPHSSKIPQQCPYCGSHVLTRRGSRRKKLEIVQLWRCASCKRTFTPGPEAIRNKTYPLRTVIDALSTYSLGYSLEDTAALTKALEGATSLFAMTTPFEGGTEAETQQGISAANAANIWRCSSGSSSSVMDAPADFRQPQSVTSDFAIARRAP